MSTAEEVLEKIFADQDSEDTGDPSDSLDSEEEEKKKKRMQMKQKFMQNKQVIRTGTSKFHGYFRNLLFMLNLVVLFTTVNKLIQQNRGHSPSTPKQN